MRFVSGRGKQKLVVNAVDDVSFDIGRTETFGLVGESGCGKTTTGRAIIRLYTPTSGKIILCGRDVSGTLGREEHKFVTDTAAMIFQDPVESLNPRMTIEEIVGEGLRARGMRNKAEVRRRVYDMLDLVGLTREHATRYPHEFSGGQRQRVGIARALITRPKLLIADEPVSALDVSIQAQVINLLNDLKQELQLSILFIAHDLSVVKYFSDRVGVMYFGKLVEAARSEDLYKNPCHPYTRALLSAIPRPNPVTEKTRTHFSYAPAAPRAGQTPVMRLVGPGHSVYLTEDEFNAIPNPQGPTSLGE